MNEETTKSCANSRRILRVLLGKPGLDGHNRGIKVIARGFRDAGFEVIYTGLHQAPEQIASAAMQEDVDLVGLSCLSGAHMHLFSEVVRQLRESGGGDIPVVGGGIIPAEDIPRLKEAGISKVFLPGDTILEIVKWVRENIRPAAGPGASRERKAATGSVRRDIWSWTGDVCLPASLAHASTEVYDVSAEVSHLASQAWVRAQTCVG